MRKGMALCCHDPRRLWWIEDEKGLRFEREFDFGKEDEETLVFVLTQARDSDER